MEHKQMRQLPAYTTTNTRPTTTPIPEAVSGLTTPFEHTRYPQLSTRTPPRPLTPFALPQIPTRNCRTIYRDEEYVLKTPFTYATALETVAPP